MQKLGQLHEMLRGYPGNCELQFLLCLADGSRVACRCDGMKVAVSEPMRSRVEELCGRRQSAAADRAAHSQFWCPAQRRIETVAAAQSRDRWSRVRSATHPRGTTTARPTVAALWVWKSRSASGTYFGGVRGSNCGPVRPQLFPKSSRPIACFAQLAWLRSIVWKRRR